MKKCLVLLLALLCFPLPAREYLYEETTANQTSKLTVSITEESAPGTYEIRAVECGSDEKHLFHMDSHYSTLQWIKTEKDGQTVTFTRKGNDVIVADPVHPDNIITKITLDESPWFGSIATGIAEFVRTGEKSLDFWVIKPTDFKPVKMRATRTGTEPLAYAESSVESVKVRVTIPNVPSLFFSLTYWFRKTDGIFLRFDGAMGAPGTPRTITQLKKEE